MKWITREHAKVDRVACPWLIKRFVDKDAEFIFIAKEKVEEAALKQGAIPFDVPGVELGHREGKCSFEAILEKYRLEDRALKMLAKIVHGTDIASDINLTPESAGLMAIAEGFRQICPEDHKKLELEFPIYDALYAYCKLSLSQQAR